MFPQGSLRETVKLRTAAALQTGALQPLDTDIEFVVDSGIEFMIRVATSLERKERSRQKADLTSRSSSPFLKPDPQLLVADITSTHRCLLNKYNVIDEHLLIVTKQFEPQQQPLDMDDFIALWKCMREYEALAFYNSAPEAGASQAHKHLQIVPLPMSPRLAGLPISAALQRRSENGICNAFPFLHKWMALCQSSEDIQAIAAESMKVYTELLRSVGSDPLNPAPYNLLATKQWMLIVPRVRECFESISLNALAFAGSFFVRNQQQREVLKTRGPFAALRHVSFEND